MVKGREGDKGSRVRKGDVMMEAERQRQRQRQRDRKRQRQRLEDATMQFSKWRKMAMSQGMQAALEAKKSKEQILS